MNGICDFFGFQSYLRGVSPRSFRVIAMTFLMSVFCFSAALTYAVVELERFDDPRLQKRYDQLIDELRCPKCQNQNLAGSDSSVSQDLRDRIRELLYEGKTNKEIKDYMVARYGDFVLYDPPKSGKTLLVWVMPVVLLILGAMIVVGVIRKAGKSADGDTVIDSDRIEAE